MAGFRELPSDIALASLWEELVFTLARLTVRASTRELAESFAELVARTESSEIAQRGHWKAEEVAAATVDVADEELDEVTDDVIAEVRHADRKANDDTRETHYLGSLTLRGLTRLGLASQLDRMRPWVKTLESEPEEALKKLAKRLAKIVTTGDAALDQRVSAASSRATHRAREITSLVADANAVRRDTYGALVRIANKTKRAKDWPESFFRHGSASRSQAETPEPVTPPTK